MMVAERLQSRATEADRLGQSEDDQDATYCGLLNPKMTKCDVRVAAWKGPVSRVFLVEGNVQKSRSVLHV